MRKKIRLVVMTLLTFALIGMAVAVVGTNHGFVPGGGSFGGGGASSHQ